METLDETWFIQRFTARFTDPAYDEARKHIEHLASIAWQASDGRTHGKAVAEAKTLERDGWHYPRHLAGRAFAVVAHGDAAGAGILLRSLTDWLHGMGLVSTALLNRVAQLRSGLSEPDSGLTAPRPR